MSLVEKVTKGLKKEGFKKYAGNVSWMFLGYVVRIGAKFLVGIYIARYLGASDYGLYSYAMSFALTFEVLVKLGFRDIVIREIAGGMQDNGTVISTVLVLKVGGALLGMLLTFVSSVIFNTSYETTLVLIASLFLLFETFDVLDYLFQSKVLAKYTVRASIVSTVIASVIKFAFIMLELPLIYFVATFALEALLYSACLYFYFRKYFRLRLRLRTGYLTSKMALELFRDSWPLAVAMAVTTVNGSIDKVMVKNMLDSTALGYYAVGMRLYGSLSYVPFAICATLFPAIINARKQGNALYAQRMKELYMLMFWMATALALTLVFFAEEIVITLFTEEFRGAIKVLQISAYTMIPLFMGSALNKYLVAEKLTRINIVRSTFAVITNLGLNLLLIPRYGIEGAAIATLVAGTISVIIVPGCIASTRQQVWWMIQGSSLITLLKRIRA